MKRRLIRYSVLVLVFFLSILTISKITNKGNTDRTAQMGASTFPIIYMLEGSWKMNELHGHRNEMEANYMRDTLTVLPDDRKLQIEIDKYGNDIKGISYEVRSLDTKRLVENTEVTEFEEDQHYVYATLNIKNLLDADTEYILTVFVQTKYQNNISYYTRIVQTENLYLNEKLQFVREFHDKTFNKEEAQDLVKYLESNSSGDNTSFHSVNIHSSFDQVTWGKLEPQVETEIIPQIKELNTSTASILFEYVVSLRGEETEYFNVKEFYRVRYTSDRIYLLDFERTMDEIFIPDNNNYSADKILLGITGDDIEYGENEEGSIVCFVQERTLWSYNNNTGRLVHVFGFRGEDIANTCDNYNQHDIKIIDIDENGNIQFMVYGYMNRGRHEGETGVVIYFYDSMVNSIEEEIFIPCEKPYQILKEDMGILSYVNNRNDWYLLMDGTVYEINLAEKLYTVVVAGLTDGCYTVSEDNRMLAWQEERQLYSSQNITILNLDSKKRYAVNVGEQERVRPLGFIDGDFIYGVAYKEDIKRDFSGGMLFPMYTVRINNSDNELIRDHANEGIYILDAAIDGNRIDLKQAVKSGNGYTPIDVAHISNNELIETRKTQIDSIVTEEKEKEIQLVLDIELQDMNPKILTPKEVIFEESRNLVLEGELEQPQKYYVYAKGELQAIYTNEGSAVNEAEENAGVVVSDNQNYIWERGNRKTRTQIPSAAGLPDTGKSELSVSLTEMLRLAGFAVDTQPLLDQGESVISILQKYIDGQVLDLAGCSLDSVLYYVSRGYPVLAMLNDTDSVLIVGYDELNTILMYPEKGTPERKGMNDSKEYFEQSGNVFVSFVKE